MSASVHDSFATIDLASASDTVSIGIVKSLVSDSWFELLSSLRSVYTRIPNVEQPIRNEKFSAMGNGYTFELETLVFFALTRSFFEYYDYSSVDLDSISVYGDDIICPSGHSDEYQQFLTFCGFQINSSKSFSSGPFRESCGKDYIYGYDVRPFFIKERIECLENFFKLYNQVRAWHARGSYCSHDNLLNHVLGCVYHSVNSEFRYRIPTSFPGDAGFHSEFPPDQHAFSRKREGSWDGWFFRYLISKTPVLDHDDSSAMAAKLLLIEGRQFSSDLDAKLSHLPVEEPLTLGNSFPRRDTGRKHRYSRVGYALGWA
jgi:hypothetical protein